MTSAKHRPIVRRRVLVAAAVSTLFTFGVALGQSPVVFMTYDNLSQSRLARFNSGVESFSVGAGASAAFHGVTIHSGNVLVADYVSERIQRFSPSGSLLAPFALFTNPTFLESDNAGNVYTTHASLGGSGVTRFNSAGVITQTYIQPGMTLSQGVDADAAGNVYVADASGGSSQLYKFAANGTLLNSVAIGGNVNDLAINEAGQQLFVAIGNQAPNGIKVFDISGATPSFIGTRPTPVGAEAFGIHYAPGSGNLLITDFGIGSADPRGVEYSPGGTLLRTYRPANAFAGFDITTFVPEPTTLTLLATSLVAACICGRGRRRQGTRQRDLAS